MIWVVDNIKTRLVLDEAGLLLDIPMQIELEYELDGDHGEHDHLL
jgi:hypothetical protein